MVALALLAAPLSGCGGEETAAPSAQSSNYTEHVCTSITAEPGAPRVYFAPFDPVEAEVLCALDRAQREVLVAHYNIRRQSDLDKLVELADRGVQVRVVVDAKNAANDYNQGDDFLEEHGIEILRKPMRLKAIMHLKDTVIDQELVMAGSFNWNGTAALANDENMVVMRDPAIANAYRNEILEVLGDRDHVVEGGPVTDSVALHFSPEERLDDVISDAIAGATESVDVAMFTFTQRDVKDALLDAIGRGVTVRVVTELKQAGLSSVDDELEQAGAWVVRGANKIGDFSAMHHKYAVLDGRRVITGATNWTHNGTRESEEDLLVFDSSTLAQAYSRNFADLLHVYADFDDGSLSVERAPVFFRAVNGATGWGDRMVVVGSDPALGAWDPERGVPMDTTDTLFPNWTGRVAVPSGTDLEYKFVQITASGEVRWEPGDNRRLSTPASGRATVISGSYGDTTTSWTPASP
jgi:phosphatidylserine/phosphatidylglycerophosphate/cardiolipin synthase-like enzyme